MLKKENTPVQYELCFCFEEELPPRLYLEGLYRKCYLKTTLASDRRFKPGRHCKQTEFDNKTMRLTKL